MRPGRTCPNGMAPGRPFTTGSAAGHLAAPEKRSSPSSSSRTTPWVPSSGRSRSTRRSCVRTSTPRSPRTASRKIKRGWSRQRTHLGRWAAAEALGRSRGGLTIKIHLGRDGKSRPLSIVLTAGQVNDSTQFIRVTDGIRVPRPGPRRPRTRPDHVIADKAYSAKEIRGELRRRGISHTIPRGKTGKPTGAAAAVQVGDRPMSTSNGTRTATSSNAASTSSSSGMRSRPVTPSALTTFATRSSLRRSSSGSPKIHEKRPS